MVPGGTGGGRGRGGGADGGRGRGGGADGGGGELAQGQLASILRLTLFVLYVPELLAAPVVCSVTVPAAAGQTRARSVRQAAAGSTGRCLRQGSHAGFVHARPRTSSATKPCSPEALHGSAKVALVKEAGVSELARPGHAADARTPATVSVPLLAVSSHSRFEPNCTVTL